MVEIECAGAYAAGSMSAGMLPSADGGRVIEAVRASAKARSSCLTGLGSFPRAVSAGCRSRTATAGSGCPRQFMQGRPRTSPVWRAPSRVR